MTDGKINSYISFYLKENLLLFDASTYLNDLSLKIIDILYDWGMYDEYVHCNQQFLNNIVIEQIQTDTKNVFQFAKKNNFKVLTYLNGDICTFKWCEYFKDSSLFFSICKKSFKKTFPNYFEIKGKTLFKKRKGKFLNMECIIPAGEDEEFLNQVLDKLKK